MSIQEPVGARAVPSTKFKDLSLFSKIFFVGKLVVFICTFGFAFPTILND